MNTMFGGPAAVSREPPASAASTTSRQRVDMSGGSGREGETGAGLSPPPAAGTRGRSAEHVLCRDSRSSVKRTPQSGRGGAADGHSHTQRVTMSTKSVYYFGGGTADGDGSMKELLGGKGANLAEMSKIGIPVPPGFTITTEV